MPPLVTYDVGMCPYVHSTDYEATKKIITTARERQVRRLLHFPSAYQKLNHYSSVNFLIVSVRWPEDDGLSDFCVTLLYCKYSVGMHANRLLTGRWEEQSSGGCALLEGRCGTSYHDCIIVFNLCPTRPPALEARGEGRKREEGERGGGAKRALLLAKMMSYLFY